MNLKDYDDIKVPNNLHEYIEKGIEKGMNNEKKSLISRIKPLPVALVGALVITTVSNIPSFAGELINIPIIGEVVKVLDFTGSTDNTEYGGMITDGNQMIIDSLSDKSINIYFTKDGELVENSPNYEIEYRKYPNTMVFTFNGVRGVEGSNIVDKVKEMPYVVDVYNLMILDDSARKIAIEFDKNVSAEVIELKNPAMIEIKLDNKKEATTNEVGYYVTSKEYAYGEELAMAQEALMNVSKAEVQKNINDMFVIQFGPFSSEELAKDKLNDLLNNGSEGYEFYVEKRELGQRPGVEK